MRTLVTGGAGFIGTHLCKRLLAEGHEVICVDNLLTGSESNIEPLKKNKAFTFIQQDVISPLSEKVTADAVFHLASPASPNHHSPVSYHALPMETMLVNTVGTLEMLKFADKNKAKFLFASTSEIYGNPLEHPQKETYLGNVSTIGPRSVYDEAKRFGETLVAYYWREKKLDARIARIFNTYGPLMQLRDKRMIISFIEHALHNEPIPVFGDGTQTRSLCYVDDTVEGLFRLMFHAQTVREVVNIGNVRECTVYEFAQKVIDLTHSKSTIVLSEKIPQDDPLRRKANIEKAKQLLDWEPHVSLEEGLQKTIEYFKTQQ
jgi:nucleoside-diphosphate-sugar epimerase